MNDEHASTVDARQLSRFTAAVLAAVGVPEGDAELVADSLDVAAFGDGFTSRMEQLVDEVKSVPPAPGFDEVFFPGELEARAERANLGRGIALPQQTLDDLRALARSTGVPAL